MPAVQLLPVLAWLLALGALTVLGAPIAAHLFRALPRNGAAFALPTTLVPFTLVTFWLGQVAFGRPTLAMALAVVGLCSWLALRAGARPDWSAVARGYAVLVTGFLLIVLVRASGPGLTPLAGEQFLHYAIVGAIERAPALPPEDPWFAGRSLRYYYGTQLQVTALSMLTGTPVRYGFNLGVATFYGLLLVVAWGLGGSIVARYGRSFRAGALASAFLVALAGPTTTAIRFLAPHVPGGPGGSVRRAAFGFVASRYAGGNLTATVAQGSTIEGWHWWDTRYVIPGTLHEVPLYSIVKADLHGHALGNGYVLFAAALGFAYYATPEADRARRIGPLVAMGLVAGLFGFTNTWSLPTVAGLAALAVAAADSHPATLFPERWARQLQPFGTSASGEPGEERTRWSVARVGHVAWRHLLAGFVGLAVLGAGVALASPFLVFGQVPANEGVGFLPPRSPLGPFLVVYSGLLTVFGTAVLVRGWPAIGAPSRRNRLVHLAIGVVLVGAGGVTAVLFDATVLAVLATLVVPAWWLVRTDRAGFAMVLLVAGAGLLASLELVHARLPQAGSARWNTSLKVAVQAWTLAAAGAGSAIVLLVARARDRLAAGAAPPDRDGDATGSALASLRRVTTDPERRRAALTLLVLALVVLASAIFPLATLGVEVVSPLVQGHYAGSIDARDAIERERPAEAAAIRWLDDREGRPTIVEAPGNSYGWTSPAATFTGLPGVIGWNHEAEYRGQAAYDRRVRHADAIFAGNWSDAARFLQRYDVTYVYVGPNERERYGEDLRSFDRPAFRVAFANDVVTIYRIDRAAFGDPTP